MRDDFLGQLALPLASSKPLTHPPYSSAHHVARPSKIPPFSTEHQVLQQVTLQNSASTCLARRHCSQPGTKKNPALPSQQRRASSSAFQRLRERLLCQSQHILHFSPPTARPHTGSHPTHRTRIPSIPFVLLCPCHGSTFSLLPHFLRASTASSTSPNTNSRLAERRA